MSVRDLILIILKIENCQVGGSKWFTLYFLLGELTLVSLLNLADTDIDIFLEIPGL